MRAPVAPLRRAAHLHRRHAARRGGGGHRLRAQGQGVHGRAASCVPDDDHDRHRRRAPAARDDDRDRGFILDGFPRTVGQAEALDEIDPDRPIDVVVDLEVPRDVVLERLAGAAGVQRLRRRTTRSTAPPKHDWICDVCGGEVVQRADDTAEAIARRLDLYERQTVPLDRRTTTSQGLLRRRRRARQRPTRSLARLVAAIDAGSRASTGRRLSRRRGARQSSRAPDRRDAQGRPGGRRDARRASGPAIRPGVTTAELDRIGRDVLERRGARSNFLGYHGFPAVICASPNDMIVHGIPGADGARGGRHRLDRLRGDRRRLARRRRLHRRRRARSTPRAPAADRGHRGSRSGPASPQMVAGEPAVGDIGARRAGAWPRRPGSRWCAEYGGHGIGRAMHEQPEVPNYGRPGKGPKLRPGQGVRRRADGERRPPETLRARRRLDACVTADGRLRGPLRAHHRRHRRRPRDPHPALT